MRVRKAIIPAAGLGTRFLPATKAQPKEMLTIVDKPVIQYIVEEAINSGIEDILIVSGRNKVAIENHFDRSIELEINLRNKNKKELLKVVEEISNMANIHFIRQKEPLGLGHAVYCAKSFIGNEPFAVLLGDDIVDAKKPCLKQLIEAYEKYGQCIIGVQEVLREDVNKYGIVDGLEVDNRCYRVRDLVEKPDISTAPSNIAILGRYILTPSIFSILEKTKPGRNNEIQLTDGLRELLKYEDIYAYYFEGKRYDAGDKLGYLKATVELALKRKDLGNEFKKYLIQLSEHISKEEHEVVIPISHEIILSEHSVM